MNGGLAGALCRRPGTIPARCTVSNVVLTLDRSEPAGPKSNEGPLTHERRNTNKRLECAVIQDHIGRGARMSLDED
jgi:hypothetical protein